VGLSPNRDNPNRDNLSLLRDMAFA
jgi:hypothetical protein